MGWIFKWIFNSAMAAVAQILKLLFEFTAQPISSQPVVMFLLFILGSLASAALIISIALAIIDHGTRKDSSINELVMGIIKVSIYAVSFLPLSILAYDSGTVITKTMIEVFTNGISRTMSVESIFSTNIFEAHAFMQSKNTLGAVLAIIVIFVFVVLVMYQQYKRMVDFVIIQLTGILSMVSLAKGETQSFGNYVRQMIGLVITQAIQVALLYSGLLVMALDGNIFLSLALFASAAGISKLMKEWAFTSGTRGAISGLGRTGMSAAGMYNSYKMQRLMVIK